MSQLASGIETTVDAFLGGQLLLQQPTKGYRAGIDPVLLAATCTAVGGQRVMDCGAGVGTVGLCVASRGPGVSVTLVERERVYAALAVQNIDSNGLNAQVTLVEADLTRPLGRNSTLLAMAGTFDHALANPPYHHVERGTRSTDALKDAANAHDANDLEAWARFMAAMLCANGRATLIHRADALGDVLKVMSPRFGGLSVLPLQPRAGADANRIIVTGRRGCRGPMVLRPPIAIHGEDGRYTTAVEAILKGGASLLQPL
jgi:tRNA1(Val) A37 N6-methylase TrmN6